MHKKYIYKMIEAGLSGEICHPSAYITNGGGRYKLSVSCLRRICGVFRIVLIPFEPDFTTQLSAKTP